MRLARKVGSGRCTTSSSRAAECRLVAVAHELARRAGLDVAQFDAALDDHRFRADIAADAAEGRKLGVTNTPTMFINGRGVVGARSFDELARIVSAEAAYARAFEADGVPREDLLRHHGRPRCARDHDVQGFAHRRSRARTAGGVRHDRVVGGRHRRACVLQTTPFCGRSWALSRTTFASRTKRFCCTERPEARLAAAALRAAARQGAFASLRERLLARAGGPITRGWLTAEARDLRLDVGRFAADLGSRAVQRHLDDDAAEANRLGILEAPAIYVDGKRLEERDRHALAALVAAERRHARALAVRVPRAQLYDELTRDGLTEAILDPDAGKRVVLRDDSGPQRGARSAPVTIVEFADFECYYCRAVEPTLRRVLREYGDRVRLVFKHHPLSDDGDGARAAEIAAAATLQGRFWPLHDELLTVDNLDDASLEELARRAAVDMGRLHATLDSGAARAIVRADAAAGDALLGDDDLATPTFVINGRMIIGAQPYEVFKQQIDQALSRRQASR